MRHGLLGCALIFAAACSMGEAAAPSVASPPAGAEAPVAEPAIAAAPTTTTDARPGDIVALFETRVLPTCSLNGGVCHNSNNAPDLRNVAALQDLFDMPCGTEAKDGVPDACANRGYREIVPGHPEKSYVVARLWDTSVNSELMPRQCRAWNDEATRALGCWIEGLRVDDSGHVTNALAPIDYDACTFEVPRGGRCGTGLSLDAIVDAECAGCHGETEPAASLDLRSRAIRRTTVGQKATGDSSRTLVVPGDAEASYLVAKIEGRDGIAGAPMPKNGRLTRAQIDTIRAWIDDGAR